MLPLGKICVTMEVLWAFAESLRDRPDTHLARHATGDWGEVDEQDQRVNEYAVERSLRVMSAYSLSSGEKIWVITEADRSSTTILLPEEYWRLKGNA